MGQKKEADAVSTDQPDVYERARIALNDLIAELCDALDEDDTESFKRKGYEMIGHYFRQPVNTGDLTLIVASVLSDILYKLELTQQGDDVSMVRDEYSIMKKEEE
ncbi:hypothetical protein AAFJ72_08850 [Brevibacillus gelatini]|uniref:Uncharacterized protein n=1 Tax=Brevibacillus gelatini TaxID=1655277 RepID=A0A3M8B4P8_9BACL|nr:hypothetical protein [Brevibacillus gelatini]RNB58424.1 hypothetical protein EDM57_06780 [Brevibacillus gelatini]